MEHVQETLGPGGWGTILMYKDKSKEINSFGKTKDFYLKAIETWTQGDPLKRETAKRNNLNYLEFWNIIDIKEFIK